MLSIPLHKRSFYYQCFETKFRFRCVVISGCCLSGIISVWFNEIGITEISLLNWWLFKMMRKNATLIYSFWFNFKSLDMYIVNWIECTNFFRDCHPQGLKNYHVLYIIIMVFGNPTAPYDAAIFNTFNRRRILVRFSSPVMLLHIKIFSSRSL